MTRYTGPVVGPKSRWGRNLSILLATAGIIGTATYLYARPSSKNSRQLGHNNILDIPYETLPCPGADGDSKSGNLSDYCENKVCLVVNVACE